MSSCHRARGPASHPGGGLTDAHVPMPVIDQPLVDLVGETEHIMLLAQAGHQLQLGPREHLPQDRLGGKAAARVPSGL